MHSRRIVMHPPDPPTGSAPPVAFEACVRVEFEALPRVAQDRFVAATRGTFPPVPILGAHPDAPTSHGWIGAAFAALAVSAAALAIGFGRPASRFVVLPTFASVIVLVGLAAAAFSLLRALSARGARELPFAPGVYVFPSEVIDARTPTLEVRSLAQIAKIQTIGGRVRLCFKDGARFSFAVTDAERAFAAASEILRAVSALDDAPASRGLTDPLYAPEGDLPEAGAPYRVHRSFWVERRGAVALAIAGVIGPLLLHLRDVESDRRAYARASREGVVSLRAYAEGPGRFGADVRNRLLPLSLLRDLRESAAIEAWMHENPVAANTAEAKLALRDAWARDLSRLSTVASIDAFAHGHPTLAPRWVDETRTNLLARVRQRLGTHGARALLEKCGVSLSIVVETGKLDLADADRAVLRSVRFAGNASYPSRHLSGFDTVEGETRALLERRTEKAFPEGCVTLGKGATLRLRWSARFAGTLRDSSAPSAVFANLVFALSATLTSADGRALGDTTFTQPMSIAPDQLPKLRATPWDDAIERTAYRDRLARTLSLGGQHVARWMFGPE